MIKYLHKGCGGEIVYCKISDQEFCWKCEKAINEESQITVEYESISPREAA